MMKYFFISIIVLSIFTFIQGCSKSVDAMDFSLLYKYNWEKIESFTNVGITDLGKVLYDTTRYSFDESGYYTFTQPGPKSVILGTIPVQVIQHPIVQTGVFRLNQADRTIETDQTVSSINSLQNRWRAPSDQIPESPDDTRISTLKRKILHLSTDSLVLEYEIFPNSLLYPSLPPAPSSVVKFSETYYSAPK